MISSIYCDFCCLVKFDRSHGAQIIRTIPPNYELKGNEQLIAVCSFPEASQQVDSVHSSTLTDRLVYHWCFVYEGERYAIALISHHFFASIFLKFLRMSRDALSDLSPDARLENIWQCLIMWSVDGNTIHVVTPQGERKVESDSRFITFANFDPTALLGGSVKWKHLWETLMTGGGVLIVGDAPLAVSNAVFAVMSAVAPLVYLEPVLAFTRLGDPRFADVINGSRYWKLVGTTNRLALERCSQFKIVLDLAAPRYVVKEDVRALMKKRTNTLLNRIRDELDDMIDSDPYANLLWKPLDEACLEGIGEDDELGAPLTADAVRLFTQSRMYSEWHRIVIMRPALREAFLSAPPESVIADRTPQELDAMEAALAEVASTYPNDGHLMAVVARHRHLIKREKRH